MSVRFPILLVPGTVLTHAPGVHRSAPGPVGVTPPSSTGGGAGGQAVAKAVSAVKALRIIIVEVGSNKLTEEVRTWVKKEILAELKSVTDNSGKAMVKKGFKLSWEKSMSGADVAKLGRGDYVAYLVAKKSDAEGAMELAKRHVSIAPSQEKETTEHVVSQMKSEGGVNIRADGKNISIVALDRFELSLTRTDLPASVRKDYMPRVARRLAEIFLHELGHGMNAEHDTGIMADRMTGNMDGPSVHYSDVSREEILGTLDAL